MNYYKQIAEMLGLELGEKFVLTDGNGKRRDEYTYKITKVGVYHRSANTGDYLLETPTTLYHLLGGHYKAVPVPWKPKYGEQYWSYSPKINGTCCNTFWEFTKDYAMWKSGNCFRTEEEAQSKGKEIMEKLLKEYEEA